MLTGVAVEKLFLAKFAKMKVRLPWLRGIIEPA
jgi:hypothetical protein